MRIFLSGPNQPTDDAIAAAQHIRSLGHTVTCPHELMGETAYGDQLRFRLQAMLTCDSLYLLRGWAEVPASKIEWRLAHDLNFIVLYQPLHELSDDPETINP